jgi:hypothetical protein
MSHIIIHHQYKFSSQQLNHKDNKLSKDSKHKDVLIRADTLDSESNK